MGEFSTDPQVNNDLKLISGEIDKLLSHSRINIRDRDKKLRASKLPYCPLRESYEMVDSKKKLADQSEDIKKHLYTGIGNVMHEVTQDWMIRFATNYEMMGNWKIKCDDHTCPFKNGDLLALDKEGCPTCGRFPSYVELAFDDKWTAHVDGLIRMTGTNRVYIIDYKTTSYKILKFKSNTLPPAKHVFQTGAYSILVKKLLANYNLDLIHPLILYIVRDDVRHKKLVLIDDLDLNDLEQRLQKTSDGYNLITKAINEDKFSLQTAFESYNYKLCDSMDYYLNKVEDPYSKCPLAGYCFGDREKVQELLVQQYARHKVPTTPTPT